MQEKLIPTTVDPRYIHPVQPIVTNDDDLSFTVTGSEQLHIYDNITFNNTVTFEGDLIVKSSAYVPDVHKNAGVVHQPTFTDNGDGTFTVGDDGIYNLYSSLTANTAIKTYEIAGLTQAMAEKELGYVYACYNGGSPIVCYTTNRADIQVGSQMTRVIVLTLLRYQGTIGVIDWDNLGNGLAEKRLERSFDVEGKFLRSLTEPGIIIEDLTNLDFKVTSGVLWTVAKKLTLDEVVASVDRVELHYKDAGGNWVFDVITSLNNTQYMTPTGLVTLTANRYAVNWVWLKVDNSKTLGIILGGGDYKLIDAQSSSRPVPPPEITAFGFFVGRVIIEKGSTTLTQIDNSLTTEFAQAAATIHNDLSERDAAACHPTTAISNGDGSLYDVGVDTHQNNGFVSRTDNAVTVATRTFTVAPTGASFAYYNYGQKVIKTGGTTCQTTCPATIGLHYIYFDNTGQLQNSMTPWDFVDGQVFTALGYWNGSAMARFEERHSAGRDVRNHRYLHLTRGTSYESGFAQTYPSVAQPGRTQVELGIIHDEDIRLSISQQKLLRHWYQTAGAAWVWANGVDNSGYDRPYIWNAGTSRIQYPKSNSGYALTDVAAAKYICLWVYANNDMDRPLAVVTPSLTGGYTTVAQARAETKPNVGAIAPEFKLIYRWIYKGDGTYVEASDYRSVDPLPGGGTTTAIHNTLLGLDGGETGYYGHLSQDEMTTVDNIQHQIFAKMILLG